MMKAFLKDESGATVVEYGLIIAVLSLAIMGGFSSAVNVIQGNFEISADIMENAVKK
ncbi:Flp family type IVb pilin [Mesorhizobium sp. CAU 1732]|uniref:Flp family type IVb pilin n=1 Tax=Mesorhizobium sp. CAU 1732 TaxID=3140358 RepID=UPI0032602285